MSEVSNKSSGVSGTLGMLEMLEMLWLLHEDCLHICILSNKAFLLETDVRFVPEDTPVHDNRYHGPTKPRWLCGGSTLRRCLEVLTAGSR